ncbi:MAG TPA: hypothetical protein EYP92_03270 [Candidatus Thioglobus sp.]|jgi:hypothetical protein|nr:hypothetical protein [Candidatus Thioglobus sp.]HIL42194.1 hypothetical protein [Gammaproteobacteria bacterium]
MNFEDYTLKSSYSYVAILVALIALGVVARVLPHPPNFSPMAAIALFAGFVFIKRYMAFLVVIVTMLLTDYFVLGSLSPEYFASETMLVVYLALLFPIIFKGFLRAKLSGPRVAMTAITCSVVFFVSTNFAVWMFSPMYEKTWAGIVLCYTMAIPFFHYTVMGDLLWSGLIFGTYYLVKNYYEDAAPGFKSSLLFSNN